MAVKEDSRNGRDDGGRNTHASRACIECTYLDVRASQESASYLMRVMVVDDDAAKVRC